MTGAGRERGPGSPAIGVIIPTYNRRRSLEELLDTLAAQTLPREEFEVVVVDDGSTDGTETLSARTYPFRMRYHRQSNAGDAAARNQGAALTAAEWLVFLDDDILVHEGFLQALLPDREDVQGRIVVGADILWLEESNPVHSGAALPAIDPGAPDPAPIPFAKVCSNNMAIRRRDFFRVGPMQGMDYPGSSIWCDVEFCYRAHLLGFEFVRRPRAFCWHRDHVARDHESAKSRGYEAAYRAAKLFRIHPDLIRFLPMFTDMTPVDLRRDRPVLVIRKFLRRASSTRAALAAFEWLSAAAGQGGVRHTLQQWTLGAHIYRGYRRGLKSAPPVR